jgi:hypothetical protein
MSGETFVDVTYRGLDLGRRQRLCEVGPTTAYLEHPAPMPVGTRLELSTDVGVVLGVEVARVHEQIAGAERTPGMRVRAPRLDARAAEVWRGLVSGEDPAPVPLPSEEVPPARSVADGVADDVAVDPSAPTQLVSLAEAPTQLMPRVEDGAGGPAEAELNDDRRRTELMSAVDVEAILATAEPTPAAAAAPPEPEPTQGKARRRGGGGRKKKK